MEDPVSVVRIPRAAFSANPTTSSLKRSPSLSVSSNSSPWFTPGGLAPYSHNAQDMMEQQGEHFLHARKDISDDEPALCPSRDLGHAHAYEYGVHVGWDWRSRKWIDADYTAPVGRNEQRHRSHRRRQQENLAGESIEEKIYRLRQDANRLVNEGRLFVRRSPQQSGGWVSELEGISERRRRDSYGGYQGSTRLRRDKVGLRSRRRANQHVLDLHGRRKLTRREFQLRRDSSMRRSKADGEVISALQLLGESIHASKSFSLQTLEEYLRERAAARRLQNEDHSGAVEMISSSQPTGLNKSASKNTERLRRSVRKETVIKPVSDISMVQVADAPGSFYMSEDGQDAGSDAQRSGCGISLRWLNAHHANKEDSSMPYATAGCFPAVSKRRIGRRLLISHHTKGRDRYNSEGSFSSFDSDSETAPLMTEPEPFHDYTTDDVCSSSLDLNRSLQREVKPKMPSRFKENARYCIEYGCRKSDCLASECKEVGTLASQQLSNPRHRSLSQKHRPKTFKDLVGQSMVAQSLSNAILRGKIAPVYLFQGPRGTGKSSAARIFTAALNCLSAEELRPCGACKECSSFHAGKNFDVREVDAAGNTGIESMKLLLKHIALPPSSRYKAFVIDECHLLTPDAWNAFLKSLEEPPSYVVFVLITTDAEQLPRTAVSRCQKFLFSKIKDADIVSRLQKIALLERIDVELAALQLIASRSDGSLRDAEMTLDQISLLGKRATLSVVQEMVGMIPEKKLIEFLELALSPDTSNTVKAIRDFMESGVEALALISQLATLITDIIAGNNRSAAYRLKQIRKVDDDRFRQALKILSDAERQLRTCSDRTTWLTAAFLQFSQANTSDTTPNSLGTSITQSPVNFFDTSEKETVEGDGNWETHSSPRFDEKAMSKGHHKRGHSQSILSSGPLIGSKVHPCSNSPRLTTDDDERTMAGVSRPPAISRALSSGLNNVEQRQAITHISSCSMESIWRKVVENSRSNVVKQLLRGEAKLVSLSVTEDLAVAHLEFRHPEHRNVAEKARTSIVKAFQEALCCSVDVKITLSLPSAEDKSVREVRTPSNLGNPDLQSKLAPSSKGESKAYHMEEHSSLQAEQRSHTRGSFRRSSSSSKFGVPVSSSPRIRIPEPRKPRHSLEVQQNTRTYSLELSEREQAGVLKGKMEGGDALENRRVSVHYDRKPNALGLQDINDLGVDNDLHSHSEESFHEDRNIEHTFSPTPMEADDYSINADKDGLDSENQYGGPGFLCWNGSRIKDGKGRHQRLRRKRRGRLLLRLVPCAKGDGKD